MALAEKGDNLKLDVTMKDVGAEGESKDEGGDMYSKLEDFIPRPVMLWGKAVGGNLGTLALFCMFQNSKEQLCGLSGTNKRLLVRQLALVIQ